MPITHDAFFVANRLAESLAQCDANILHRVMRIDVQIATATIFRSTWPWRAI